MDNIEQLKLENQKLAERLNNAAKFFRDQKAQIEQLTKENEELKRTPKEEVISTEKWNALVTEKENLNEQLYEYKSKLQHSEAAYEELRQKYTESSEKIKEIKTYEDRIAKLETENQEITSQYGALTDEYDNLKKIHNALHNEYNDLTSKFENVETDKEELQRQLDEMTAEYDKAAGALHESLELDKKYDDLKRQNEALNEKLNKYVEAAKGKIDTLNEQIEEQKIQLDDAAKKIDELEQINKTTKTEINEYKGKYDSLMQALINLCNNQTVQESKTNSEVVIETKEQPERKTKVQTNSISMNNNMMRML